jgi:hypothetical protein
LAENRHSLSGHQYPFRARFRRWQANSERLLSPKETLKTESQGAEFGGHSGRSDNYDEQSLTIQRRTLTLVLLRTHHFYFVYQIIKK